MILVYVLWRAIAFLLWFGVMFALFTIAIATALVLATGAMIYGALSPTRTPRSALRSLVTNTEAAFAEIRALRPS